MTLFGCPPNEQGILIGRVFGSSLMGLFLLYFVLRNSSNQIAVTKAIILPILLFNLMDIPIMTVATIHGILNILGWIPVVVNMIILWSALWLMVPLYLKKENSK